MKNIKRLLGIVWMILSPLIIFFLAKGAYDHIELNGVKEINDPVVWVIIITIFTPIALGLFVFGWYAWKGEYDR